MGRTDTVGSHKTTVMTEDGVTTVCYHNTGVVKFGAGAIILNSGGYLTKTTKLRMNQASRQYGLGYSVYQKDHSWYVDYNGETLDFEDGMLLERNT